MCNVSLRIGKYVAQTNSLCYSVEDMLDFWAAILGKYVAQTNSLCYKECVAQTNSLCYRECVAQTNSLCYRECVAQANSLCYGAAFLFIAYIDTCIASQTTIVLGSEVTSPTAGTSLRPAQVLQRA